MSVEIEKMLDIHNKLKGILDTLQECNDLWMSDIRTLSEIVFQLRTDYKFVPPMTDDGERAWWSTNWVMEIEDDKE